MTTDALSLYWLPPAEHFAAALSALRDGPAEDRFRGLTALANSRLDFLQTRRLDRALGEAAAAIPDTAPRLRLALLGSSSQEHLVPGIRVGALRRGLVVEVEVAPYGQWRQQAFDPSSSLHAFEPDAVLLALDQASLLPDQPLATGAAAAGAAVDAAVEDLVQVWRALRERSAATVIQQLPWSDDPPLFGHGELLVPGSAGALAARLRLRLAEAAVAEGVVLLDVPAAAAGPGLRRLGDPSLWHHAKQAVSPAAVPWYGDQVGRVLAALRGLSKKVLVLDLDNTIWGGTIGDDGVDGIVLGQGSGAGEAFAAFQRYARRMSERGVLLAACSKNDESTVVEALAAHPEMVLRREDFAAFEVSWGDKPAALQRIARDLNLGIDSLVFVDDNPAERAIVRRTLPAVAVPELPEAPELYGRCVADAGFFDSVSFTAEDSARSAQYAANRERRRLEMTATDMDGFLRDLDMTLTVGPFQPVDVKRIAQLINKTNQFNVTTRRYTEAEVRAMMEDPNVITYAARLSDRFGDNGLTSVVIARRSQDGAEPAVEIDTWLMSCRVLGRRVEDAMLSVIAGDTTGAGATRLIGRYRPTPRNGMVRDLFKGLGFSRRGASEDGETEWELPLAGGPLPAPDHLRVIQQGASS